MIGGIEVRTVAGRDCAVAPGALQSPFFVQKKALQSHLQKSIAIALFSIHTYRGMGRYTPESVGIVFHSHYSHHRNHNFYKIHNFYKCHNYNFHNLKYQRNHSHHRSGVNNCSPIQLFL